MDAYPNILLCIASIIWDSDLYDLYVDMHFIDYDLAPIFTWKGKEKKEIVGNCCR
jgi:hypothetical protein